MLQNYGQAMREASLPSLGCFAYTLQLTVNDGGVLSQRDVIATLAVCTKLLGTLTTYNPEKSWFATMPCSTGCHHKVEFNTLYAKDSG